MKLWKGITAAALVLTVAPIIGVIASSPAEAAAPTAVKAAATSYNQSCENPDGSYSGGVCKNDGLLRPVLRNEANPSFPASVPGDRVRVTVTRNSPIYPYPVYYLQPGQTMMSHASATASLRSLMERAYDNCVGAQGQSSAFCAGYYKDIPAIPRYEVLPASEMFPELSFETTWQGFIDNTELAYDRRGASEVVAERID